MLILIELLYVTCVSVSIMSVSSQVACTLAYEGKLEELQKHLGEFPVEAGVKDKVGL